MIRHISWNCGKWNAKPMLPTSAWWRQPQPIAHETGSHGKTDSRREKTSLKIVSASLAECQDELRRESPNSGSAGLAVNSPHFTGHALDLYVGGDPVDTRDSNRKVQVETRFQVARAQR